MSTDKPQKAELDHVFIWTEKGGGALREKLEVLGLVETYHRFHVGQGTANICYCFENAFIELLWIEDEAEALSAAIAHCQFVARSKSGNPFGIAWRGDLDGIDTWDFKPPYLPDNLAIKVARDSDDILQPFMFTFPGSKPPSDLPPERRGVLQQSAGFECLEIAAYITPIGVDRCEALDAHMSAGIILTFEEGEDYQLDLKLKRAPDDARGDILIRLPI